MVHSAILVIIMASVTILLRFLPFIIFNGKQTPKYILYLGNVLPYSIMGMLVIYCLKNVSLIKQPYGLPELISVIVVVLLHGWKRNTLLSIICGTVCYMVLIQTIF